MTSTPRGPFPVLGDISDGESGHGYVLRMATANLLNALPAVKAMLGRSRFAVLDAADAKQIAFWFGADPIRLAQALGRTGTGQEPEAYELAGIKFTRSYFLNRSQPRVCVRCLAERQKCMLAWEISLATACGLHGLALTARCSRCCGAVRWDRPHLMQCRCGWLFQMTPTESASPAELDVSQWIEARLGSAVQVVPRTAIGRLLAPIGLDAGLHVLCAVGALGARASGTVSLAAEERRRNSLVSARESLARAEFALEAIRCGAASFARIHLAQSAYELLSEAAASEYAPPERQLALSLLVALGAPKSKAHWGSRYPQLSQLELF